MNLPLVDEQHKLLKPLKMFVSAGLGAAEHYNEYLGYKFTYDQPFGSLIPPARLLVTKEFASLTPPFAVGGMRPFRVGRRNM